MNGNTNSHLLRISVSVKSLALELTEANNISQDELQFLWQQFNKYSLNEDNLIQCDTTEFSDPFTKNVFRRIPRAEDKPNNIEFASYVQVSLQMEEL